jgi:restriction system protein
MSVPPFNTWLLPLLKRLADGQTRPLSGLAQQLADDLGLSPEDRAQMLSSGQLTYQNRIGWARTYLKKAGLLESPSRGTARITGRGRQVLAENRPAIDVKYLYRFPEFVAFHTPAVDESKTAPDTVADAATVESPEDTLERVSLQLRQNLASELLEKIKASPPDLFERLVVDLLLSMGYGGSRQDAGEVLGKSGDGGLDGVIKEDRLGLDAIYVQAKRWDSVVGRPVVQAFAGSLEGVRARKGVLITTSTFSPEAYVYVRQIEKKIVLLDGNELADLMIEHNLAVSVDATYVVKRLDNDYFET